MLNQLGLELKVALELAELFWLLTWFFIYGF